MGAGGFDRLHDTVFVDSGDGWPAINIRPHNDVPKEIAIYDNTIFTADTGITINGADMEFDQMVAGNVIFAQTSLNLSSGVSLDENLTGDIAEADTYFTNPTLTLGEIDLYPLAGQLAGTELANHLAGVTGDADYDRDFNGIAKDFTFRGAYQGEAGSNPGWQLDAAIKAVSADDPDSDVPGDDPGSDNPDNGSETDGSGDGGCFIDGLDFS